MIRQSPWTEPEEGGDAPPPDAETRSPEPDNGAEPEVPPEDRAEAAERELAELRDRYMRQLAEQDNLRRHERRVADEAVRFAASKLAEDLVGTLDNLQLAIESISRAPQNGNEETVRQLLTGVAATERSLLDALARHGIRRTDPLGEPFDPRQHHAMFEREEPDAEDGTVIEVVKPGYFHHERLLRPALVGVAKNAPREADS